MKAKPNFRALSLYSPFKGYLWLNELLLAIPFLEYFTHKFVFVLRLF